MLEGIGADGGARQAVPAAAYQERPAHAAVRLYVDQLKLCAKLDRHQCKQPSSMCLPDSLFRQNFRDSQRSSVCIPRLTGVRDTETVGKPEASHQVGARRARGFLHSEQPFWASSARRSRQLQGSGERNVKTTILTAKQVYCKTRPDCYEYFMHDQNRFTCPGHTQCRRRRRRGCPCTTATPCPKQRPTRDPAGCRGTSGRSPAV